MPQGGSVLGAHFHRRRFTLERLEGRSLLSTVHLTVNTLADDPSGPVAGQTTLRDAITAADAGSTANKYVIKFAVNGTIALAGPLPALTGNIAVKGPGAANLIIQPQSSVHGTFVIGSNAQYAIGVFPDVEITGITIENNVERAIFNIGNLIVKDCVFTNNTGGDASCIVNDVTMKVSSCSFSENGSSQPQQVGELSDWGPPIVTNDGSTSVLTNDSFSNNYGYEGAVDKNGTMTVHGCSFVGNTGFYYAGALFNWGTLTISSSSFEYNSSAVGGAIYNAGASYETAFLTLTDSTFVGNTAPTGPDIFNAGTATIGKKIIAALGDGIYNVGTLN